MSQSKKQYGLRLTLGGAPNEAHQIPGLPGFYRPDRVTPVGGPGEATEEQAREFAGKRSKAVELVEIKASEVDDLRAAHNTDYERARGNDTSMVAAPVDTAGE